MNVTWPDNVPDDAIIIHQKPYTLDGILTGLLLTWEEGSTTKNIVCRCGHIFELEEPESLRFHYTHCSSAKRTPRYRVTRRRP